LPVPIRFDEARLAGEAVEGPEERFAERRGFAEGGQRAFGHPRRAWILAASVRKSVTPCISQSGSSTWKCPSNRESRSSAFKLSRRRVAKKSASGRRRSRGRRKCAAARSRI